MPSPIDALRTACSKAGMVHSVVALDIDDARALLRLVEDGEHYLETIRQMAGSGGTSAVTCCREQKRCVLADRLMRVANEAYHRRNHATK